MQFSKLIEAVTLLLVFATPANAKIGLKKAMRNLQTSQTDREQGHLGRNKSYYDNLRYGTSPVYSKEKVDEQIPDLNAVENLGWNRLTDNTLGLSRLMAWIQVLHHQVKKNTASLTLSAANVTKTSERVKYSTDVSKQNFMTQEDIDKNYISKKHVEENYMTKKDVQALLAQEGIQQAMSLNDDIRKYVETNIETFKALEKAVLLPLMLSGIRKGKGNTFNDFYHDREEGKLNGQTCSDIIKANWPEKYEKDIKQENWMARKEFIIQITDFRMKDEDSKAHFTKFDSMVQKLDRVKNALLCRRLSLLKKVKKTRSESSE